MENQSLNNRNNLKVTELMKKTSKTIIPTNETKEKIWERIIDKTKKDTSFLFKLRKGLAFTFSMIILIGVGTITMELINPKPDNRLSSSVEDKVTVESEYYEDSVSIFQNGIGTQENSAKPETNDLAELDIIPTESTQEENDRVKSKTASITISVEELSKSTDSIYSLIKEYNGYTETININQTYAKIIIKVPSEKFDEMYSKIRGLGNKIVSENIVVEDKQTELDNIQYTINNLQAQIDELKTQFETETNADNKKNIENQIKILEEKIDPLQKQKNNIVIETSYSTIEVSMTLATKDQDATKTLWIDLKNVLNFWLGMFVKLLVGGLFIAPIVGIIWVIKKVMKLLIGKR